MWAEIRQICAPFAKRRLPKKASNLVRTKNLRENVDEIIPRGKIGQYIFDGKRTSKIFGPLLKNVLRTEKAP